MSNKSLTIKEMLKDLNAKIEHIEDITADNRAVIIKLVKQSNQIVKFLRDLEIEAFEAEEVIKSSELSLPDISDNSFDKSSKAKHIKELIEEFLDKHEELKELEEELKKNKDMLTPGQLGEA